VLRRFAPPRLARDLRSLHRPCLNVFQKYQPLLTSGDSTDIVQGGCFKQLYPRLCPRHRSVVFKDACVPLTALFRLSSDHTNAATCSTCIYLSASLQHRNSVGRAGCVSVGRTRTQLDRRSFYVVVSVVWNALPVHLRSDSISRGHDIQRYWKSIILTKHMPLPP